MTSQETLMTKPIISEQIESKKSNIQTTFPTILITGSALLFIIIVVIIYYIRSSTNKNKELIKVNEKYEELVKQNNELQAEMAELQEDNKHYIQHINHLSDQLEQQQNTYSPITPMTVNSYEAPDPNQTPTKPQPIKDKEAIRAMVNSKRPTVQDEIDNRKQQHEQQENDDEEQTKQELKDLTNDNDDERQNDDKDENVKDLMTIIQSQ